MPLNVAEADARAKDVLDQLELGAVLEEFDSGLFALIKLYWFFHNLGVSLDLLIAFCDNLLHETCNFLL